MTPITLRGIIIKNVGALQAPLAHVQFGGGHEHKGVPFFIYYSYLFILFFVSYIYYMLSNIPGDTPLWMSDENASEFLAGNFTGSVADTLPFAD